MHFQAPAERYFFEAGIRNDLIMNRGLTLFLSIAFCSSQYTAEKLEQLNLASEKGRVA